MRPRVDEIVLVWTTRKVPGAVDGVDRTASFDGCNAQMDCPTDSTCQCKAGDLLDFSMARNESFRLASGDLLTYVDSDDVVVGTGDLRALYRPDMRTLFRYQYQHDAAGSCTSQHYVDRLVPKGSCWTEPVHNLLHYPEGHRSLEFSEALTWKHERVSEGTRASRLRSLRILKHWEHLPRYENDARFIYYLGRVHLDCGLMGRAATELERAFRLETFVDQKVTVALDLTKCWSRAPQYGLEWGHRALELRPEWPAPWLALARMYHALSLAGVDVRKNGKLARQFLRSGLEAEPADTMTFVDPYEKERTARIVLGSARAAGSGRI